MKRQVVVKEYAPHHFPHNGSERNACFQQVCRNQFNSTPLPLIRNADTLRLE
jgi:hypothetical protein